MEERVYFNRKLQCIGATTAFLQELEEYLAEHYMNNFLEEELNEVLQTCGFQYSRCGMYQGERCYGFKIIHYSNMEGLDEGNFYFPEMRGRIDGMMSIFRFHPKTKKRRNGKMDKFTENDWQEIWDVCVHNKSRGKGISKKMFAFLDDLNEMYRNKNVKQWLAMDPENPMWKNVLQLYVDVGFQDPYITNFTTQQDMFPTSIALTRDIHRKKNTKKLQTETIIEANRLRKQFFEETKKGQFFDHSCFETFVFSGNLLEEIWFRAKDLNFEVGGPLRVKSIYRDNPSKKQVGFIEDEVLQGSGEPYFTTPLPEYKDFHIYFHTHPNVCYPKIGCFVAWPSIPDVLATIQEFISRELLFHLVFTVEGIYFLGLSIGFQKILNEVFLNNDLQCFEEIKEVVKQHFAQSNTFGEFLRSNRISEKEEMKRGIFKNYLTKIQRYTLKEFISEVSERGFTCLDKYGVGKEKMFQFFFTPWSDIRNQQGIFDIEIPIEYIAKNKCGLDVDPKASQIDIF